MRFCLHLLPVRQRVATMLDAPRYLGTKLKYQTCRVASVAETLPHRDVKHRAMKCNSRVPPDCAGLWVLCVCVCVCVCARAFSPSFSCVVSIVYSVCIPTGDTRLSDTINGFFLNMDASVDVFAEKVRADPQLAGGFNAFGLSQG